MGNSNDGGAIPQNVQDLAKKVAGDLADHPDKLPDPLGGIVADAKKFPGKLADGIKKDLSGPAKPGDANGSPGTPSPVKRHTGPDVKVAPDVDPSVKFENGKPQIGGTAGAHVTVTGKDPLHGTASTVTLKGAGGTGDHGSPTAKADLEAGGTVHAGGQGQPKVTIAGKVEAHAEVDKTPAGVASKESVRGSGTVDVNLGHGFSAGANAYAGVDGHQGAGGRGATPNFGVSGGITFTPGADGTKSAPPAHADPPAYPKSLSTEALQQSAAHARGEYKPGEVYQGKLSGPLATPPPSDPPTTAQILAAKLQHDVKLMHDAPTEQLRKLAGDRAAAEQKVLASHPEWKDALLPSKSTGTSPGDFQVENKNGVGFAGQAVELPASVQREVQNAMQGQTRGAVADRAPEAGRAPVGVAR